MQKKTTARQPRAQQLHDDGKPAIVTRDPDGQVRYLEVRGRAMVLRDE